ncbi:MAG: helix-turn-helix transcriptional regulator, partial [Elusimicrobia bacterium]|nr:helix-turn-helix transcriptional regulator [Elusimicrobiota bacterium]
GRRVKAEREARHLTQSELAEAAGLDAAHLSRIEHGKTVPSVNMVKKLADALALPLARMFADVPARRLPDYGWAGKLEAMVRDLPPRKRARVLRALKTLAHND